MLVLIFAVIAAVLGLFYSFLANRPELTSPLLQQYLLALTLGAFGVVVIRLISYIFIDVLFRRFSSKQPSELLRLIISFVLYGISAAAIFRFVLGADVAALLTTSAVLTAVLGLAMQATLGNLFEGLSIQVHQPFHIGDWIEIDQYFGRVESLTWRAVMVLQEDNTVVAIPNNMLTQGAIRVFRAGEPFRAEVSFPAPVDVPPRRVVKIVTDAVTTSPDISQYRRPEVIVHEIAPADGALNYMVRFYVTSSFSLTRTQGHIRERIWYALARAGIPMPVSIEGEVSAFKISLLRSRQEALLTEQDEVRLLGTLSLFRGINQEVIRQLVAMSTRLIFAPGELIAMREGTQSSLFVVIRGLVSVPYDHEVEEVEPYAATNGNGTHHHFYWQPEVLETIRQQYAEYMGPMSGYLVQAAARLTPDPYHLYRILAEDIPNPVEREAFISLGPDTPSREIEQGDFFGAEGALLGEAFSTRSPRAMSEVELIEVGAAALHHVLTENPTLFTILSQNLYDHLQQQLDAPYHYSTPADVESKMRTVHLY